MRLIEVVKDAHRRAKHGGRWEDCRDPVCAAIEEHLYHQTRPPVSSWAISRAVGAA